MLIILSILRKTKKEQQVKKQMIRFNIAEFIYLFMIALAISIGGVFIRYDNATTSNEAALQQYLTQQCFGEQVINNAIIEVSSYLSISMSKLQGPAIFIFAYAFISLGIHIILRICEKNKARK